MHKKETRQLFKKVRNNIIVLTMFVFVVLLCTGVLRRALMVNTNQMGLTLVENYSSSEESNMSACEAILTISVNYVEEREQGERPLRS